MLDLLGDFPRICNNAFVGAFRAEIVELGEHFVRRAQVERRLAVGITIAVRLLQHGTINGILGVEEVHVTCRDQHFVEFSCECVHLAVDIAQVLIRMDRVAVVDLEEVVVVDGLNLKEVIELRHLLKLLIGTSCDDTADEFARLACGADDDPLTVLFEYGTRDAWATALFRAAEVADV